MSEMTDYFALFELPRHLHVDVAALEKGFYAQSRGCIRTGLRRGRLRSRRRRWRRVRS
jgi:hypothetical protein